MDTRIARVILTKEGSNPLIADDNVSLIEEPNGVVLTVGHTRSLIPWHRIYEIEYVRKTTVTEPLTDACTGFTLDGITHCAANVVSSAPCSDYPHNREFPSSTNQGFNL